MTRTSPGRLAACVAVGVLTALTALVGPLPAASAVARTATGDTTPLQVSIDTLHPSTVPTHGRVTITGEITNTSQDTWTGLYAYMLRSTTPITSQAALAEGAASDPATEVGSRLAGPDQYDAIGDLAPGQSTSYVLSVPRRDLGLSGQPGVYWFGVHVLGAVNGVRDSVADGRARTFLPLVPPHTPKTRLALEVPIAEPVRRDRDGRLIGLSHWERMLAPEGRLDRVLRLTGRTGAPPVAWVVDPAVLDAARSVARGNPPLDIGPTDQTAGAGASDSGSPSQSPSQQPTPSGRGSSAATSPGPLDAAAWLRMFQSQSAGRTVLAVPYGNLDIASAARHQMRPLFGQARALTAHTMAEVGVKATPVVAPASGYLPGRLLAGFGPRDRVLLSDHAFPTATGPALTTSRGTRIVLSDTAAGTGGPGPDPRYSALAVRQRILSEAALHALSTDHRQPIVVSTPRNWDPGVGWSDAAFFEGLAVPWLKTVDLKSILDSGRGGTASYQPVYPQSERRSEVPFANLLVTHELLRTGHTFATLLARNSTVDEELGKAGMLASSTETRDQPHAAADRARATNAHIHQLMDQVQVEGPPFVTMSSGQGQIQITVVNGLDQPITVGVHAHTGTTALQVASPDPVTLGPGRRASMRLTAQARDIGVHRVLLEVTDATGEPLGSTAQFTVRTSQVGQVIWVIMGVGGAVLLAAIAVRLVRRIRHRTGTRGPLRPRGSR